MPAIKPITQLNPGIMIIMAYLGIFFAGLGLLVAGVGVLKWGESKEKSKSRDKN